ncbi:MAG: hypothetical protein D8H97_17430 [Neisseria sp.]|nr:MAG: hypothetical protein D8H97_17430 [Neisseria sp.]
MVWGNKYGIDKRLPENDVLAQPRLNFCEAKAQASTKLKRCLGAARAELLQSQNAKPKLNVCQNKGYLKTAKRFQVAFLPE